MKLRAAAVHLTVDTHLGEVRNTIEHGVARQKTVPFVHFGASLWCTYFELAAEVGASEYGLLAKRHPSKIAVAIDQGSSHIKPLRERATGKGDGPLKPGTGTIDVALKRAVLEHYGPFKGVLRERKRARDAFILDWLAATKQACYFVVSYGFQSVSEYSEILWQL